LELFVIHRQSASNNFRTQINAEGRR